MANQKPEQNDNVAGNDLRHRFAKNPQLANYRPPAPVRRPEPSSPLVGQRIEKEVTAKPIQPSKPQISSAPKELNISLNLSLPTNIRLPRLSWQRIRQKLPAVSRKQLIITGLIIGGLLLILAISMLVTSLKKPAKPSPSAGPAVVQHPDFPTLLPGGGKSSANTPKVDFDVQKKVASYNDRIAGINIILSQQPLPQTFKDNPEAEVQKLATGFNATKVITAGDIKAFSGVSSKDGSQTAIFTKKDLLVFIRAQKELDKAVLSQYITNLQ